MAPESRAQRDEVGPRGRALVQQSIGAYNRMVAEQRDQWLVDGATRQSRALELLCTCGRSDCEATVVVTIDEYDRIRAQRYWTVVAPGHETEIDRVIERKSEYTVVEVLERFRLDAFD